MLQVAGFNILRPLPSKRPSRKFTLQFLKGEIYVTGGFVPSNTPSFFGLAPTSQVHVYSPTKKAWRTSVALPEARHHLGLLSNTKYLYGIGGFKGDKDDAWQVQNSVFRKLNADSPWLKAPVLPVPVAESVYATCGENLHVIGGITQDQSTGRKAYSNNHFVLLDNERWDKAAPPTINRSSAAGTQLNDKIYVFGGRQAGKKAKNLTFAEVYDKKTDRWQAIRPLPLAVAGLTAVPFGQDILVTGGEAFGSNGNWKTGSVHNNAWLYSPDSDTWTDIEHLPEARHGHGAVNLNGSVFLIGGALKVGPQATTATMIKVDKV